LQSEIRAALKTSITISLLKAKQKLEPAKQDAHPLTPDSRTKDPQAQTARQKGTKLAICSEEKK
jgi:hypothetical protein